ncbi:hypothetical protein JS756_27645 [Streptomyces actuosus]|uniref:Uncharacterized protein n=1 Tax=Streptomyces actuosus TaxID=1885 RepID=A0ABS2VXE2_STRAS|nr:hypothetical protein [Streptomyces actuosus]MBN0047816.1 hypothetical protein [Streptomyces actuosus]
MNELCTEDAPALLLAMVPESADYISELYEMPAADAVRTDHPWVDMFDLLTAALADPIIIPQLRSESPDSGLLQRCFDYTEQLITSPSSPLREAVYFQVIEALLGEDVPFQKAFPYMRKATWERTVRMLNTYEVSVPGVTDC